MFSPCMPKYTASAPADMAARRDSVASYRSLHYFKVAALVHCCQFVVLCPFGLLIEFNHINVAAEFILFAVSTFCSDYVEIDSGRHGFSVDFPSHPCEGSVRCAICCPQRLNIWHSKDIIDL